ncbi:MAG: ABC transporter permease [Bacillota bacterium]|jgi:ABC-2 type transport system permease protein
MSRVEDELRSGPGPGSAPVDAGAGADAELDIKGTPLVARSPVRSPVRGPVRSPNRGPVRVRVRGPACVHRLSAVVRLYVLLISAAVRAKMQYKFDFVTSTLLETLMGTYDYLIAVVALWRFHTVAGWNIYEIGLLYSVSKIGWGLYRAFLEEVDRFEGYIVRGDFDSILIRPYPSLFVLASRNFAVTRLSYVIQGAAIMVISLRPLLRSGVLNWAGVVHLALALLWTTILFCAVGIATSAAAFIIVRIEELQVFTQNATSTATLYPLEIYPAWLRNMLLYFIPLGVGNYIPVRYLLGKGGTWLNLAAPGVAAFVSLAVAVRLWHIGEARYHSTGS